jgi:hypothetical protein
MKYFVLAVALLLVACDKPAAPKIWIKPRL